MMFEMTNSVEKAPSYQCEFAMTLLQSLEIEEALQVCRDNCWYSIWEILRNEQISSASRLSPTRSSV